jgi:hypothetical protein
MLGWTEHVEINKKFWSENLKDRDQLEGIFVDGRIILNQI